MSVGRVHVMVIVSPTERMPSRLSSSAATAEARTGESSTPKSPTNCDPYESQVDGRNSRAASRIGWRQVRRKLRLLLDMLCPVESRMVIVKVELVDHTPL